MAKVREVLLRVAHGIEWRHAEAEPVLLWKGFGSSSVDWEISVWADDPWRLPWFQTDLGIAVWDALKEAGITIAFPQVDVHLDPPVADALQLIAGGRGVR
jgi:small-conductance mechanosensitive channel